MGLDEGTGFRLTGDFLKKHGDDPKASLTFSTEAVWALNVELGDRLTANAALAKALATIGRARAAIEKGKLDELYDVLGVEPRVGHRTERPWRLIVYRYHEELFRAHTPARLQAEARAIEEGHGVIEEGPPYSRSERVEALRVVAKEFEWSEARSWGFKNTESARLALIRYRNRIKKKPDRNLEGMLDVAFGTGPKRLPFELPGPLI